MNKTITAEVTYANGESKQIRVPLAEHQAFAEKLANDNNVRYFNFAVRPRFESDEEALNVFYTAGSMGDEDVVDAFYHASFGRVLDAMKRWAKRHGEKLNEANAREFLDASYLHEAHDTIESLYRQFREVEAEIETGKALMENERGDFEDVQYLDCDACFIVEKTTSKSLRENYYNVSKAWEHLEVFAHRSYSKVYTQFAWQLRRLLQEDASVVAFYEDYEFRFARNLEQSRFGLRLALDTCTIDVYKADYTGEYKLVVHRRDSDTTYMNNSDLKKIMKTLRQYVDLGAIGTDGFRAVDKAKDII